MSKDITPYDVLAFQYKPLEKTMLKHMKQLGLNKQIAQYKKMDKRQKVFILDKTAQMYGL